ncbi:MAG: hypothetical protein IH885_09360 [Myxococcales bacterium]|nr:hypothetical protein [Myxococcales bacterium]
MPLTIIRTLATATAAIALLIGCGSEESTPDPQGSAARRIPETRPERPSRNKIVEKMDPDGKGMHLTATDPAGQEITASIGDEIEIPEEFPKDVPIFPGSTPMAFLFAPDEGIIVTFKSTEEQQEIYDYYQSTLADDGWEILEEKTEEGRLSFEAIKQNRKVAVIVAGTKGDSRVSVIVTDAD